MPASSKIQIGSDEDQKEVQVYAEYLKGCQELFDWKCQRCCKLILQCFEFDGMPMVPIPLHINYG